MPKLVKVKNAILNIKLKAELKEKVKVFAESEGKTITDVLTEFIENLTLKTK